MPTQQFSNYANLITFTRASSGTALRPVSYGPELLSNGDFSNGVTGWTAGASSSISVSGGALVVTEDGSDGTSARAYQAVTTVIGRTYNISIDVTAAVGRGQLAVNPSVANIGGAILALSPLGNGTVRNVTASFVATSTTSFIILDSGVNTAGIATFDNISVKEVIFDQAGDPLTLFNHPNNVPRIEYDSNRNRLGILIEEARTNLFRDSGDFTTAGWFKNVLTVSAATDDFYTLTSTGADSNVTQSAPVVGSSTYTFSAEFKARSQNFAYIQINSGGGTTKVNRCYIDLTTGQVVNAALVGGGLTGATVSSVRVSSDTWRVILTATSDSNHNTFVTFSGPATSLSATSTGAGQTVDMRRLQIELGAFPTSYIPTTGAAATRAADIASISTSAFGYNTTAGTVVCEFDTQYGTTGYPRIWEICSTSTTNNRILVVVDASSGTVNSEVFSNSSLQGGFTLYSDPTPAVGRVALAFAENSFSSTANGATPQTDSAGTMTPSVPRNSLTLGGASTTSTSNMSGHLKALQYYPRQLSPAQIQELTR